MNHGPPGHGTTAIPAQVADGQQPSSMTAAGDERVLRAIDAMTSEVMSGPEIYRPSKFWQELNDRNRRQIVEIGLASFKRTVNQNYFNWLIVGPRHPQFIRLLRSWIMRPHLSVLGARLVDWEHVEVRKERVQPFRRRRARLWYALFVALLWDRARRSGARRRLDALEEPGLGDPILVRHAGRLITQDLANSAMELEAIEEALSRPLARADTVVELGAGYGRLAWMALASTPGLRYILVDIPPALAIAEEYLTSLFPERNIFRFRHIDDGEDVQAALGEAEIAFLTPNQLEAIRPQHADVFVNISSFDEMRPDQVANFLAQADRHTDGIFYMKQWRAWSNEVDGVTIHQHDYPIPSGWDRVFERDHPVQSEFFEAAYQTRPGLRSPAAGTT